MILDCDPGHDDAVAIVAAAAHADLVGITTVAGNAPLTSTTHNACVMRELTGIDVPVHAGAARPLVAPERHAGYVHGRSGLDGADLPAPRRGPDGHDAVDFIVTTCRERPGTWIVGVGPLTNVALALRAEPELADLVAGISIMGGGAFGNRTATAEFNVWADPEAASIVFASGAHLVLTGLDVTHSFLATPDRIAAVRSLGGRLATTLAELFEFFSARYAERHEDLPGAAVHDPLAVLAVTHPEVAARTARHVVIETTGEHTRGMTVVDRRTLVDRPAPNCDVVDRVDVDAAWRLVIEAIAAATPRSRPPSSST